MLKYWIVALLLIAQGLPLVLPADTAPTSIIAAADDDEDVCTDSNGDGACDDNDEGHE